MRYLIKVRGNVLSDVNRLFPEPPTKLGNICDGSMIKGPKRIFVESFDPFSQSNLYTIRKQVVLTKQVLLLNSSKELWIISFPDRHSDSP